MRVNTIQFKLLSLIGLVLALELVFVGLLAGTLAIAYSQSQKERLARDVIAALDDLTMSIQKASIGVVTLADPAYNAAPGDPVLTMYTEQRRNIPQELESLQKLVTTDPEQIRAIHDLEQTCLSALDLMERCRRDCHVYNAANDMVLQYKFLLGEKSQEYTQQNTALQQHYTTMQQKQLRDEEQSRKTLNVLLIVGLILNVLWAFGAATGVTRTITRRLNTVAANSVNLTVGRPLEPPLAGDDEISNVDRKFHQMAAELTEASRRERAIVDNALDLICSISENDQFTAVNPAARILGYSPEDLIGLRYIDLIQEEDRSKTRTFLQNLKNGPASVPLETRLLRKDGGLVDVTWSAYWSKEEKTYYSVIHDISARKELERLKQEFVAMVSHDLRTPLSAIRGTLTLMGEGVVDPQSENGKRRIADAESSTDRLIKLVTDLLDLEKFESGKMPIQFDYVNMTDVVRRSIESVRAYAERQNIQLEADSPAVEVTGDEDRLIQVLVNLLSNAIKFSPTNSKVSVSHRIVGSSCQIRVTDSGPGVPPEYREAVFQRFRQIDTTRAQHKSGSGLGLSICKEIVAAHNGTIGVESANGTGSTFWFQIPLAEAD